MRITLAALAFFASTSATYALTYDISLEVGATRYNGDNFYDLSDPTVPVPDPFIPELVTVTGQVTTDGTLGMLEETSNVLSWSLRWFDASNAVDVSFDSEDADTSFIIDFVPPFNLGPIASESALTVLFEPDTGIGTEMQWQFMETTANGSDFYELKIGPDRNEVIIQTDLLDIHYVTDYFGPGTTELQIGSASSSKNQPAPIPLPASGWLLLTGLGGLFALGRRKAGQRTQASI